MQTMTEFLANVHAQGRVGFVPLAVKLPTTDRAARRVYLDDVRNAGGAC